jgi:hypothetical protein
MNFKDLKEETIGLANQTFAETFEKVFRQYWQTAYLNNTSKNYNISDAKNGLYQALIPTMATPEFCMKYSSIIIKVVPDIDQEQAKHLADALHKSSVKPCGTLDSELIVIVALQRHGWTHGFKQVTNDKGGYLTAIFVANDKGITSTNELWRKLMSKVIIPFYEKRLFKFMESFNLIKGSYVKGAVNVLDKDNEAVTLTNVYYRNTSIIDSIDMTKGLFIRSMSHFTNWLHVKLNWFLEQFKAYQATRQAERKALEHCTPIPLKLRIQSKRQIIETLTKSLNNDLRINDLMQANKFLQEKDLVVADEGEHYLEVLAERRRHG